MMRIDRIVLREIDLPLKEPFRISSGTVHERRILLVELVCDGVSEWSECVAAESPNYSPETVDTAWLALTRWVGPRVVGRTFRSPDEVAPALDENFRGHPMAKAAVEMGAWALHARLEGISLSTALGGERTRVPVGVSMGIQDSPADLVALARRNHAQGYRKLKIKVAPGKDLEFVAAVRDALGPDVSLMVDANAAYRPEDTDHLLGFDAFGLTMIEQPLDRTDLVRHARLHERLRTPICLDESIDCPDRAEDMLTLGAGRIVNIKPGRVGGFAASRRIHDLAREAGVPVWCGGMLESGIGRAHNVALASLPNFSLPGDLSPSSRYWARDIVDPPWTMDATGHVDVPVERPGIGVDVDRAFVEARTTRSLTIDPN